MHEERLAQSSRGCERYRSCKREPHVCDDSRASIKSGTRSGWRKPAVGYRPIVPGERNHSTKTDRHCRCGFRSHGRLMLAALVEPASLHRKRRYFPGNERRARRQERGALAPRGFSPQVSVKRGKSSRGSRRRGSENHGGLTVAALVNVRLCTANVAIFQRTDIVHQERLA